MSTKFVYFGGEPLGVPVLNVLNDAGIVPALVVCNPDRPVGRKQELTPPPVKVWAEAHGIEVYQPDSYKDEGPRAKLAADEWDVFVVVAYNFILPQWLLDIPNKGVINVHPSLLPQYRGASPIRSAILDDNKDAIGVSVMLLDSEMDHGPILAQEALAIPETDWPIAGPELDTILANLGGTLLAKTLPNYLAENITPQEQNHEAATYCGKLTKAQSEIALDPHNLPRGEASRHPWLTYNAFLGIGNCYFIHQDKRVKINEARLEEDTFLPITVTPEGKQSISFQQYLQSI